jgi:NAD+ kinase
VATKIGVLRLSDRPAVLQLEQDLLQEFESVSIIPSVFGGNDAIPADLELLLVLGGDGTILSAVEKTFGTHCQILGVNLGRVGFLAEAESSDVHSIVSAVATQTLWTEERVALKVEVLSEASLIESFALNEVAIEKIDRSMMVELNVAVDGDELMAWSGDGLIVATPTGSTAYAFSAGGPIIWPTADVLEVIPIAAHALFSKPIVLDPKAVVEVRVGSEFAIANLDGRRAIELKAGDVVRVTRAETKVSFARISKRSFTNRLVAKFRLPVSSWRDS